MSSQSQPGSTTAKRQAESFRMSHHHPPASRDDLPSLVEECVGGVGGVGSVGSVVGYASAARLHSPGDHSHHRHPWVAAGEEDDRRDDERGLEKLGGPGEKFGEVGGELPLFEASTPPPSRREGAWDAKGAVLPLVAPLARKLFPAVARRIAQMTGGGVASAATRREGSNEDDFAGKCFDIGGGGNLKTTGLEGYDHCSPSGYGGRDRVGAEGIVDEESGRGFHSPMPPVMAEQGGADSMEFLPQSAAQLVSALEGSRGGMIYDDDTLSMAGSLSASNLSILEIEAEALLDSMLRSPRRESNGGDSSGTGGEVVATSLDSYMNFTTTISSHSFDGDDASTGSFGDDMRRMDQGIASLQRDMRGIERRESLNQEQSSRDLLPSSSSWPSSIFLRWFSRGSVVEQKLINSFVVACDNDGTSADETGERSRALVNNPALLWSVSLLWAFVILLAGHGRIAALMEDSSSAHGGGVSHLVDFVEWLFYDSFHG